MSARPDITPGPPLSVIAATAQVVAEQAKALRREARRVRKDGDGEAVHDMRVATRRLRTALQAVRGHVAVPKPVRTGLRRLAKQLGAVRDRDVILALLGSARPRTASRDERERLARLEARLTRRRDKSLGALRDGLRGKRWDRLKDDLARFVARPAPLRDDFELASRVLGVVSERLGEEVARNPGMTAAAPAPEALHALRIDFKRLRYALDFHASACGLSYEVERRMARELQDVLGDIHDRDLLLERLEEGRGAYAGPWPALTARLTAERARLLRRFRRLRAEWTKRTKPEAAAVPLQSPRFVNLEVQPVTLRLVTGPRVVA